jgi:hypothetical protein
VTRLGLVIDRVRYEATLPAGSRPTGAPYDELVAVAEHLEAARAAVETGDVRAAEARCAEACGLVETWSDDAPLTSSVLGTRRNLFGG